MKYFHAFRNKFKVAFYLALLSFIIIVFNILMKNNVLGLEKSVESMYRDRLVAAATISSIIEITYENHLHLEEHIHTNNLAVYDKLEQEIRRNHIQTDSLLHSFKQTLLVEEEKKALDVFVAKNNSYKNFQQELLTLSREGAKSATYDRYHKEGHTLFSQVLLPAHQLSGIQTSVGKEIYKASQSTSREAQIIFTLEAGLVIIILSGIYGVLMVSNSIVEKGQKFWLN